DGACRRLRKARSEGDWTAGAHESEAASAASTAAASRESDRPSPSAIRRKFVQLGADRASSMLKSEPTVMSVRNASFSRVMPLLSRKLAYGRRERRIRR